MGRMERITGLVCNALKGLGLGNHVGRTQCITGLGMHVILVSNANPNTPCIDAGDTNNPTTIAWGEWNASLDSCVMH